MSNTNPLLKINVYAVVAQLLKKLNVKVSKGTVERALTDHPSYPSLFSISECLRDWSITNVAFQIDKNKYDPLKLHYPFIAHCNSNGDHLMLIDRITEGIVVYSDEKGDQREISEAQFLAKWSGVALYATANENSGEENYRNEVFFQFLKDSRIPVLILIGIAAIAARINIQTLNFGLGLLLLIKLAGVYISTLLLIHIIDDNNPLIQNLCSVGRKNKCNTVLKTDAAKIFSWLTWSEVGFFYFVGSSLCILIDTSTLSIIFWINIISLPYILYSLTYQYRNKTWCMLCCVIQAILAGEFLSNIIFNSRAITLNDTSLSYSNFLTIFLAFAIPITVWFFLKPFLIDASQLKHLKKQLNKFKFDLGTFNQALVKQPRYFVPDDIMPIVMGNPEAETTVTMVGNPFCGPCRKAHETFDKWLKTRTDIKLKIIFSTADHDEDESTKISRHISALSLVMGVKSVQHALNDWYKGGYKRYGDWAAKHPVELNKESKTVTEKQKEWCKLNEIDYTPTIFVNGYKLPNPYRIEDLKYLLT